MTTLNESIARARALTPEESITGPVPSDQVAVGLDIAQRQAKLVEAKRGAEKAHEAAPSPITIILG